MVEQVSPRALVTESTAEFRDALPHGGEEGGALLGLDLGTKTIGVATCDAGWRFATAGATLPRGKFTVDAAKIREVVQQRRAVGVVIGLPRNMDGSTGARVQSSRAYADNLAKSLALPVLLWDERWSSISAERDMIASDTSRAKRAERIDSHAAAIILQGAIDALAGSAI
ncbi:MAG: Holliday junction resolvase RuvX [Erythrobacter sp.]